MALPELTKKQIEKILGAYCQAKVPAGFRDRVRISFKFRGNSVTLFEERPSFGSRETWVEIVVAQFRFNSRKKEWTLYCADRNSRWHPCSEAEPSRIFEDLLKEVDEDPTGIFWG